MPTLARPTRGAGAFFGGIAPHLQPRFYSISSAPQQHPHAVHITCAVVREKMPTGERPAWGTATDPRSPAPGMRGLASPSSCKHMPCRLPVLPLLAHSCMHLH